MESRDIPDHDTRIQGDIIPVRATSATSGTTRGQASSEIEYGNKTS